MSPKLQNLASGSWKRWNRNTPLLHEPNLKMMQCFTQMKGSRFWGLQSNAFRLEASILCLCCYSQGYLQFYFAQVGKCVGNLWMKDSTGGNSIETTDWLDLSILHRALQPDAGRYSPMHWHLCVFNRQNPNQLQTYWYTRDSRKLWQGASIPTTGSATHTRMTIQFLALPDPPVHSQQSPAAMLWCGESWAPRSGSPPADQPQPWLQGKHKWHRTAQAGVA